jgi:hypothetical protein
LQACLHALAAQGIAHACGAAAAGHSEHGTAGTCRCATWPTRTWPRGSSWLRQRSGWTGWRSSSGGRLCGPALGALCSLAPACHALASPAQQRAGACAGMPVYRGVGAWPSLPSIARDELQCCAGCTPMRPGSHAAACAGRSRSGCYSSTATRAARTWLGWTSCWRRRTSSSRVGRAGECVPVCVCVCVGGGRAFATPRRHCRTPGGLEPIERPGPRPPATAGAADEVDAGQAALARGAQELSAGVRLLLQLARCVRAPPSAPRVLRGGPPLGAPLPVTARPSLCASASKTRSPRTALPGACWPPTPAD